jgi:hypothetical protein
LNLFEIGSDLLEIFDWPSLLGAARIGMNDREIFPRDRWDFDARRRLGKFLGREKSEGQMRNGFAKFGARGAVPGIDFVERFEHLALEVRDADEIQASVGDRSGFVGKSDQRNSDAWDPHLGVAGSGGFESWQGKNDVADGAGADQKASHSLMVAADKDHL